MKIKELLIEEEQQKNESLDEIYQYEDYQKKQNRLKARTSPAHFELADNDDFFGFTEDPKHRIFDIVCYLFSAVAIIYFVLVFTPHFIK